MTPKETKLTNLTHTINAYIAQAETGQRYAINRLEQFNTTVDQYRKDCFELGRYTFALGYLRRIKEVIEKTADIKRAEGIIRFHAAHLGKYMADEDDAISEGQRGVKSILDRIIADRFE